MTDTLTRLTSALADRYTIQEELGAERFVQEIETTANLQHPHILPLFDSGEADSFLFYVMPFIDGETLRDKLNRETQLGIDEAVNIITAIADALDYAHQAPAT